MSDPAQTLARGRKLTNWLSIALVASVLVNIATPLYYSIESKRRDNVVVFDMASGSLLLSPVVDPGDSKEILDVTASWVAKAILDRNPAGLDNDDLVGILFDRNTTKKVRDEFAALKKQYMEKSLRSHVEISSMDAQSIGAGRIRVEVSGQVITTGTVHGTATQQVQTVGLDVSLARNPDLGRNRRYPLMCYGYTYTQGGPSLAKQ